MNYCPNCAAELQQPNPNFCSDCAHGLRDPSTGGLKASPPSDAELQPWSITNKWNQWDEVLGEDVAPILAVDRFRFRFAGESYVPNGEEGRFLFDGEQVLTIGVLIRMKQEVQASLTMQDQAFVDEMNNYKPEHGPVPGNACMDYRALPQKKLWRDASGGLVSRAAALAYYWGGPGQGRAWHFARPLQANDVNALVNVEENRIDFKIIFKSDMDYERYVRALKESFESLQKYFTKGVSTKTVTIKSVGNIASIVLFPMERA